MAITPSTAPAERVAAAPVAERRHETWLTWEVLAVAAVMALALFLRLYRYTAAPFFTDNQDEVQFAWAGLNTILHGDAYTWSYFHAYPSFTILNAYGTTYPLVHHWMDHPPLFSLVMGGWLWLLGVRDMVAATAAQVRIPPIAFSTLTIPLTYLFARPYVGRYAALCGAALLATAPAAVLLSREPDPESLQAVLLLVCLILTRRLLDDRGGAWTIAGLLACAVAAPLLRLNGIAVGGTCAVILAACGRWRLAAALVGAAAAAILLFVAYGAAVDWTLFVRVWSEQAGNRRGVMPAFDLITAPAGVNRELRDGWWVLGWIGVGLLAAGARHRRELFLVWPVAAYLATMAVLIGGWQAQQYGWLRMIVYPEVYLAAGWLTWEAISRRSLGLMTLVLVLGGATAMEWWPGGTNNLWTPNPVLLSLLIAGVLAPAVLVLWRRGQPFLRDLALGVGVAVLAAILLGNTIESLVLDRIFNHM